MASVLTLSPPQVPVIGKSASIETTVPVAPQAHPTWSPAEVDFAKLSAVDIASCDGLLILRNVLSSMDSRAALAEIGALLDEVACRPGLGARANQAYTKNMVYKDSHHEGRGGPNVDAKRVIDLSPQRLSAIGQVDASLASTLTHLAPALAFFNDLRSRVATRALQVLAEATGINVTKDTLINYRMVDYYCRKAGEVPPRCGEHRDFGTLTLIFESRPGLQVMRNKEWVNVSIPADGCLLLFGWVTQVRSNDRVPAILHRVRDPETLAVGEEVPRRVSAVLFVGPEPDTDLTPVLRDQVEPPKYRSFVSEEMRKIIGRKWRAREGTLVNEAAIQEEAKVAEYVDQDALVDKLFRLHLN